MGWIGGGEVEWIRTPVVVTYSIACCVCVVGTVIIVNSFTPFALSFTIVMCPGVYIRVHGYSKLY